MALTFSGFRQTRLYNLFSRPKMVRDIISAAGEIQDNLDWARTCEVPVSVSVESSARQFEVTIVKVDHSPADAYIQLCVTGSPTGAAGLKRKESLILEYTSNRANRFLFHSFPLSEVGRQSGELRIVYPPIIESFQEPASARLKNPSTDPIPVDVAMQRGVVIDIGSHGLKFTSNRLFEKGDLLQDLQVDLPRYGPVQGSVVVKYMQRAEDYPLWRYFCGVEFTDMKPKDQRRLNRYVNRRLRNGS